MLQDLPPETHSDLDVSSSTTPEDTTVFVLPDAKRMASQQIDLSM